MAQVGSTMLVFSVASFVVISRLWIIILMSFSSISFEHYIALCLISIKITMKCRVGSHQLPAKYLSLWSHLIG